MLATAQPMIPLEASIRQENVSFFCRFFPFFYILFRRSKYKLSIGGRASRAKERSCQLSAQLETKIHTFHIIWNVHTPCENPLLSVPFSMMHFTFCLMFVCHSVSQSISIIFFQALSLLLAGPV